MSAEFGWWSRDENGKRFQVRVNVFGGAIEWTRKQGHHSSWEPYGPPTPEDWDILNAEADKRVPRRIIADKTLAVIRRRGA